MIRLRHTECAYYVGAALLGLLLCGCEAVSRSRSQIADTHPAPYENAKINYRVDEAVSTPPPPGSAEGRLVSYNEAADAGAKPTVRTLAIQYPHPAGKNGYALVELVVESRDPASKATDDQGWLKQLGSLAGETLPGVHWSAGIKEAWALDMPRADLDHLLVQLRETGYFHEPDRIGGTTEITAQIDGVAFRRPWDHVPDLDALAERVRREGSLTAYTRPAVRESGESITAPGEQSFLATLQRVAPRNSGMAGPAPALRRLPPVR